MLRALGAQRSGAETDNIEACRGLDGRRLRFTNDEKKCACGARCMEERSSPQSTDRRPRPSLSPRRIAEWTAKQEERQREAEAKKKAKVSGRPGAITKHTQTPPRNLWHPPQFPQRERELQEPKHTFDHHSFSITVHEQCATVNEAVAAGL